MTTTAPPVEASTCKGEYTVAMVDPNGAGWIYHQCLGCIDCDPATVAARAAAMTEAQAFARLPRIDEEAW